ncbi:transcription elongation factor GreA [candidate division WWE3 bacterium RIFCSPHIGHO2_01_FULL_40_23]|uniref:Transcription elongation factor GreA n=1 Tax=candidate division WWE3 bacterium RIFCSPLOWO2_01_FULL_41_18 TaxID=1802625 RepID=A0A1F4VCT9_UNCKA|nr:MAG: transcription elongation factor GreA [candidate division WWE3 bacterium RIFCSPHIGHO2_01_FULL_40_23]OGC55015.1 MAG: transcription elongation factor GreA [candidate division WWE3 bacterium RIFCSPLOWO2_01_FULL_41_18]
MKKSKVYLTKEGFEEIKKEYKNLVDVERSKIAERIKSAREMGDISENAEYESARERQAFIEGRITELEEILKNVETIKENKNSDVVDVGCVVKVHVEGGEEEFYIVGAVEANPMERKISHESPLGLALMGKRIGDKVEVEAPVGKLTYTILSIK